MHGDFSSLYHQSSKDHTDRGRVRISSDPTQWPDEWKTTYYKTYPRLLHIPLARERGAADLFEVLEKRRSRREFSSTSIDKAKLSQLLLYSAGILDVGDASALRSHPSGGARFPIEIYPVIFSGTKEVPAGVYHYNIRDHELDSLWKRPFTKDDIKGLFVYPWVQDASFAIIMTAVFWRTRVKYGERGYRYILLEAGHISENMYLVADSLGLRCCAMGGTRDVELEKLLDIDGITESVIHSVVMG